MEPGFYPRSVWQGELPLSAPTIVQKLTLVGQVVIVTGGNSGTGYATCKALYEKGATVYLACRSRKKALKAIDDIQRGADYDVTGVKYPAIVPDREEGKELGRLEFLELDLADLSDIERCVREFEQKEQHLDVLYANAGVMAS